MGCKYRFNLSTTFAVFAYFALGLAFARTGYLQGDDRLSFIRATLWMFDGFLCIYILGVAKSDFVHAFNAFRLSALIIGGVWELAHTVLLPPSSGRIYLASAATCCFFWGALPLAVVATRMNLASKDSVVRAQLGLSALWILISWWYISWLSATFDMVLPVGCL